MKARTFGRLLFLCAFFAKGVFSKKAGRGRQTLGAVFSCFKRFYRFAAKSRGLRYRTCENEGSDRGGASSPRQRRETCSKKLGFDAPRRAVAATSAWAVRDDRTPAPGGSGHRDDAPRRSLKKLENDEATVIFSIEVQKKDVAETTNDTIKAVNAAVDAIKGDSGEGGAQTADFSTRTVSRRRRRKARRRPSAPGSCARRCASP